MDKTVTIGKYRFFFGINKHNSRPHHAPSITDECNPFAWCLVDLGKENRAIRGWRLWLYFRFSAVYVDFYWKRLIII